MTNEKSIEVLRSVLQNVPVEDVLTMIKSSRNENELLNEVIKHAGSENITAEVVSAVVALISLNADARYALAAKLLSAGTTAITMAIIPRLIDWLGGLFRKSKK